ncbi:ATP-grasp domain-containing protein [Mergibacter septicus]|uniref:ATP-grasp domain-containing protein n=1 Tax=Mergibacter septicus TaxID=221402 RepID=UPI00223EB69D|nr:RimK family alpha-L-glutamate ligase [Mergibacter septicus]
MLNSSSASMSKKKLLLLCRAPWLYSCTRLKEVAEISGYQLDIVDPNRFILRLNQEPRLFYQAPNHHQAIPFPLDIAGVIPRFGTTSTEQGCRLLRYFEDLGIPVLNSADSIELARNKWKSLYQLKRCGIPVPESLFNGCDTSSKIAVHYCGSPTILKTLNGSQGVGVILAEQTDSAISMLETLQQAEVPVLLQQFISEARGTDLRCFVIGEKVITAMQRHGQNGEFRANFHRGGTATNVQLTPEEIQLAIKATKAIGLDIAGVDLIRSNMGSFVLEVNASPGLELIEQTTKLDLALQMLLYLERKMKN